MNNGNIRCINIDWLQLYCICKHCFALPRLFSERGFMVKLRSNQTRHFAKLYDVYTKDNHPFLEIQSDPYSLKLQGGIWEAGALMVKLNNRHCYAPDAVFKLCEVLTDVGVSIKSISRLDVAADFIYFDNGLKPETLIKGFFADKYWKVGQTNWAAHGQQKGVQRHSYLRFGTGASSCSCYLYNKSKELREVKEKPWIRDAWVAAGYHMGISDSLQSTQMGIKEPDVWRLEFSLKTDARHLIRIDNEIVRSGSNFLNKSTGEVLSELSNFIKEKNNKYILIEPININTIDTTEGVMSLFFRLYHHYFIFRYRKPGVKKSKSVRVPLFVVSEGDKNYKPFKLTNAQDSGRMVRIIDKYINSLAAEKPELLDAVRQIRAELACRFRIRSRYYNEIILNKKMNGKE